MLARICRPQNRLDAGPASSDTPGIVDPVVAALAQLVRDRWAAEQRERAAAHKRLRMVEGSR